MIEKLKRLLTKILRLVGLKAKKVKAPDLGAGDQTFQDFYQEIKGKTLVTKDRCFMLYQFSKNCSRFDGSFAEVGVYKGGTARLISKTNPQKKFYLFDSFSGMPSVNEKVDLHEKGDFNDTSLEGVQEFLKECKGVVFKKGFFPDTASDLKDEHFAFVHIDVDIYQSIKDSLEYFYPRLNQGGVMMFDDYQWKDTPGVEKAIKEFMEDKKESIIISTLYQCYFIKG